MRTFKPALLIATALPALVAAPALAQTAASGQVAATPSATEEPTTTAEKTQDIVVTGTLIRGAAPVGSAIIGISRQDIVQTGLSTTEDILKSVPQISNVGPSANAGAVTTQNSNLNNTRANAINIRGIGPQATLPLLDGRRLPQAGSGGQLFDADAFPAIALARVDIVADGASATYGSDAVAGVANFIIRKNVEGLETNFRYGFADDTRTEQASGIGGHVWDSGAIMVAAQYEHDTRLLQSRRAAYYNCNETQYGYANNCVTGSGTAQTANIGAPGNITFNAGAGQRVYGLPGGTGVGVTAGQLLGTPNIGQNTAGQDILPASKKYNFVLSGHQDIGPITLWTEDYYYLRDFTVDGGYLNFSSAVPQTNPYYVQPGAANAGATAETVQYALVNEVGTAKRPGFEDQYQVSLGADARLGGDFKGTVYAEHNSNHEYFLQPGLNSPLLATSLACTQPGNCFNPYGAGGANNAAAAATFVGLTKQNAYFDSNLFNAKADGTVFRLPGGAVKLAVGGEYHWDKILNYNYGNTTAGLASLSNYVVTTNSRISRRVGSVFGEVIVPIFGEDNARPFFQKLTLDGAVRYDHYSDVGGTTNPKFGITYAPARDITFRGSYGTSFRAPTLCDVNPLCTPATLSGVQGAVATTLYPIRGNGAGGFNTVTIVGGNASVRPETAHTYSAGFDFKPVEVPGLAVSLNYFHVDYKNIIYTPGNTASVYTNPLYAPYINPTGNPIYGVNPSQAQVQNLVSLPFFAGFPALPGCGALTAANTAAYQCVGAIINGTRSNAGEEKLSGLDFSASYHHPAYGGTLNFGLFGTYLFQYNVSLVPGSPFVSSVNQLSSTDAALGALLRFKARGQVGFDLHSFDANAFVNYTNAYRVVGLVTAAQNDRVAPYATLDLTFGYTIGDEWRLHDIRVGANIINATNNRPPIAVVSTTQEYDPTEANILGRQVSFTIGSKF